MATTEFSKKERGAALIGESMYEEIGREVPAAFDDEHAYEWIWRAQVGGQAVASYEAAVEAHDPKNATDRFESARSFMEWAVRVNNAA